MRVVLLTHGGADLVIEKLCEQPGIELSAVFVETSTSPQRSIAERLRRSVRYDGYLETVKKFSGPLLNRSRNVSDSNGVSEDRTAAAAAKNGVRLIEVENYHNESSRSLLSQENADLGIIFGTNIIKESVFSIPRLGSINLHQGLAPFYRGGPPVFWELYNDEKEIGLTVHFVAAKVDTGDIILQEKIPLVYDSHYGADFDSFIASYRAGLRRKCAEMVAGAAAMIANGNYPRIEQDTSLGKRYRLPVKAEKDEMRRRLKERLKSA